MGFNEISLVYEILINSIFSLFNRGAGENCMMTESFPNYYKTECRQIYVYRPLLTLDKVGDDAKIVKEQFRFPGGCKCILKKPELP